MKSMKMIQRAQRGFTLIELMIVVAIIGILAAVAIPQYQDYTIRARMASAITAADPIKIAMAEAFQSNGTFPADNAALTALGVTPTTTNEVTAITVTGSSTTGTIVLTLAALGTGVPANSKITLTSTPGAGATAIKWAASADSTLTNKAALAYITKISAGS